MAILLNCKSDVMQPLYHPDLMRYVLALLSYADSVADTSVASVPEIYWKNSVD